MHEGLYKHVGETPLRMLEKGGLGVVESLQKAACGECMYGCERERGKAAERESSRESFSRRESIRAKNSICNIKGGAAWKTHEGSRKYCRSAVHERASLTSGNATVWSQCYATCSLPSYCQGHGSERGEWKGEGADGCKAEG